MYTIDDIIEKVKSYIPDADTDLIKRAYLYAANAHEGQKRLSGVPYIQHPLATADIAATLRLDVPSVCAALLHDVKEDAPEKAKDMLEVFGPEITHIVEGVTKLEKYRFNNKEQKDAENFKKMILAMSKDIRVLLVKLCDRLHNMRELQYHRPEKQKEIARETLTIYAPLAGRLGIYWIKSELEDLSFKYLYPQEYKELSRLAKQRLKEQGKYIKEVIDIITKTLTEHGFEGFKVTGRIKNLYSIYRKMLRQNIDFSQVMDFVAFRVIVQEESQCWTVMGHIHSLWTPIPSRFRDFLNVPKPNGYRSLHTTVFGPKGQPIEIQIRTWEMHHVAESGVAAHWKYKEGGKIDIDVEKRFNWLKQLIEWARELKNPSLFLESLENTLDIDEVYVFTPNGDLKILARDATPIDFAYAIHTEVGHHTKGAKVNGRLVPLNTPLKNEDVVEIITAPNARPSRDWLKFVVTSRAKNKIRQYFQQEERKEAENLGRQLLDRTFKKHGRSLKRSLEKYPDLKKVYSDLKVSGIEEIYLQIGKAKLDPEVVFKTMYPEPEESEEKNPVVEVTSKLKSLFAGRSDAIVIDGVSDLVIHLAKCCNPIPGDRIVGFITRGRGITIHRADCPSVRAAPPERIIEARWRAMDIGTYQVPVSILAEDKPGILAAITKILAEKKVNISSIYTTKRPVDSATQINMILEVDNLNQLEKVLRTIRKTRGVVEVRRLRG